MAGEDSDGGCPLWPSGTMAPVERSSMIFCWEIPEVSAERSEVLLGAGL